MYERLNEQYAIVHGRVYFFNEHMAAADAGTFRMLGKNFACDDRLVFFCQNPIRDARPRTFKALDSAFGCDGVSAYWELKPIRSADAKTFRALGFGFAADAKRAYYEDKPLKGADPKRLVALGPCYASDGNDVFCGVNKEKGLDPRTFKIFTRAAGLPVYLIRGQVRKDDYAEGDILEDADPATMASVAENYVKDAKRVWHMRKPIVRADAPTFRSVAPESHFMIDARRVYYFGSVLKGADARSFVDLGWSYGKDDSAVYFADRIVAGAEVASFEVLPLLELARDRKRVYRSGKVLKGPEAATFEVLSNKYGRDAKSAFTIEASRIVRFATPPPALSRLLGKGATAPDAALEDEALWKMLSELFDETYSDRLVVELTSERLTLSIPQYSGVDSSDYLEDDFFSFASLKKAVRQEEGELATGYSVSMDIACSQKQALKALRRFFGKLGYPRFEPMFEDEARALFWVGYDLTLSGENAAKDFWAFHERRVFNYCLRFTESYFGSLARVLNGGRDVRLEQINLYGDTSRALAFNSDAHERDPKWFTTPLFSSRIEKRRDVKQFEPCLARALKKLERAPTLIKLSGKQGFKAQSQQGT